MPDRKVQPKFNISERIDIKKAERTELSNGIPVYVINAGKQDVVKIDMIFDAGLVYTENPLIPDSANYLIDKGSNTKKSSEIAEILDFYGAYLDLSIGKHQAQVTLYSLNKYMESTTDILADIVLNAIYAKREAQIHLQNKYQEFLISRQKTELVANENFFELLFGASHPYGRSINEASFKEIEIDKIRDFYKANYSVDSLKIIISGSVGTKHMKLLDNYFGKIETTEKEENANIDFSYTVSGDKTFKLKTDNSIQSSIRIGKISLNKHHPDYFKLNIASILLGGYFGSRLMTNIREDKGYTYGIYSSNMSLIHAGVFTISAESGKQVYQKAIDEIYKELKMLRTEPVSNEELKRVKNWIMGSLTKIFDGPFASSDALKSILNFDLGYDYFERYFETIRMITPEIILETADQYLRETDMNTVVVGSI
jgi:predicted Zn-dependent peptidase